MGRAGVTVGVLYIASLVILSQRLLTGAANTIRSFVGAPAFVNKTVETVNLSDLKNGK